MENSFGKLLKKDDSMRTEEAEIDFASSVEEVLKKSVQEGTDYNDLSDKYKRYLEDRCQSILNTFEKYNLPIEHISPENLYSGMALQQANLTT